MIFWVLPNCGFKTVSSLKGLICEFAADALKAPVEISVKTQSSLWKQLFLCLRQPRDFPLPDMVQIPHHWTTLFSRLGLFQDLSDWDPQLVLDGWMETLRPHCLLAGTDRIYSLPWWAELSVLHYRSDHFKEVTSSPQELLGTWDGLLEACRIIQKKRQSPGFHPLENSDARGAISVKDLLPCIWNRQGKLLTSDMGRVIHKDETVRGIEDYLLLAKSGYLPLMNDRLGEVSGFDSLSEGGASMALSRRFVESPDIKTVPFPGISSKPGSSLLAGHNLAVLRNSRNCREAFALLKWLTRSDIQTRYARTIRAFPPIADLSVLGRRVYTQILPNAKTLPNITVCGTCEQLLDDVLWKTAKEILRRSYSTDSLVEKLIMVQAETDYLLSLYGDR